MRQQSTIRLSTFAAKIPCFCIVVMLASCSEDSSNDTSQTSSATASSKSDASANKPATKTIRTVSLPEKSATKYERTPIAKDDQRFVDLDPELTGINLPHVWAPPAKHRNLVNPIFGAGVAIGDFDNDGLQDVFIGRQTDAGRLYRNVGNMKFEDVTTEMGIDPNGMWTSGTTFVDINNDGHLDLYLCGFDCPNRLYINDGEKFTEQAKQFGLDFRGCSIEMAFADYDNDGDLDGYLVTNYMRPENDRVKFNIVRRRGQAPQIPEKFREMYYFIKGPNGGYKRMRGGQYDHFYRNDGDKFTEVTTDCGIGLQPYMGLSANWWDYNHDGWPDLYVANDFAGPDFLYRNNGPNENGVVTFTDVAPESLPHTPWFSMGSDFADINNDGLLDYLGSDMAGTNHYRDKLSMGNMSGPGSNAWFLNHPVPPQYMRNALYLNTGTPNFMEAANLTGLAKTDWTWSVKFADLDNDGWQDVFFTNGMTRDLQNADLLNDLRKVEQEYEASEDKSSPIKDVIQDFWEAQEPFRLENMAFQNTGDLKFKNVGTKWGLDHLGVSTAAAVGDLDNDGDLDLVVNSFEEPIKVYRNDLATSNSIRVRLIGLQSNRDGLGAMVELQVNDDEKQIRYSSPTRGFMSTNEPNLHFGIGDNESIASLNIRWPSGIEQQFNDLEANHSYTIVETQQPTQSPTANEAPNQQQPMFRQAETLAAFKHTELEFDDFERQPLLPNKMSQLGPGMAWADIDGDNDDDLYISGAGFDAGKLIENLGNGNFAIKKQDALNDDSNCEDMAPLFVDVDDDGDQDLYVVSGGVECKPGDEVLQDRLYINDGSGEFERSDWLPDMKFSGSCVAAVDFDRDGKIDLFVGGRIVPGFYPETPRSALLRNTGEGFETVDDETTAGLQKCGMITSAIWSDVDGDYWPDLLLATDWGPIQFFRNDFGTLVNETDASGLGERTGWYNSITSGDIDNDGDIDYVVGNTGLNTKYKATAEKPEIMYYGDFEGNGRKRIVEAKYENGVCLPRRGLSCTSHAMPIVKEKLPTFHEFAISDLSDIYTDDKLDEATKFEANNLRSGVLINETLNGKVRFRFKALPMIAQVSPIFGSVLVDVDDDGNLDLYVAQNFYGPQRETGYMDGGVSMVMMGDGKGEFTPISPSESGLVVLGDATSLTTIDLNGDGKVDFVVGRNNSTPLTFINQSIKTSSPISINDLFDGPPPIGGKLRINHRSGSSRLHEITAGSGYLSQSRPRIFGDVKVEVIQFEPAKISQPD